MKVSTRHIPIVIFPIIMLHRQKPNDFHHMIFSSMPIEASDHTILSTLKLIITALSTGTSLVTWIFA